MSTHSDSVTLNWTQTIEHIRHWETLLFENAKSYFTIVAAAIGAAGAVMAWSTVSRSMQIAVIFFFLLSAFAVSICAYFTVRSTHRYLGRLYGRRRELELEPDGKLKLIISADAQEKTPPKRGKDTTVESLKTAFLVSMFLEVALAALAVFAPAIERLN